MYSAKFQRTLWFRFVSTADLIRFGNNEVARNKYICLNLYNKSHSQCKSASIRHSLHLIQIATWLMVARCFCITFRSGWHLNMQKVWIKCHELVGFIPFHFKWVSSILRQNLPSTKGVSGRHYGRWYNVITGRTIDNCVVLYHYFNIIVLNLWNTVFLCILLAFPFCQIIVYKPYTMLLDEKCCMLREKEKTTQQKDAKCNNKTKSE